SDKNDLITRSMAKPPYKEKLRLRTYGIPTCTSTAFLEIKKKYDGIVYKRRAAMPYAEAERFLDSGRHQRGGNQIEKELAYFRDFYRVKPAMFLAYDREAFAGRTDPYMRMTIDRNIRYRTEDLSLLSGDAGKLLNMDGGELLEVKVNGALPMEIVRIFNDLHIYPKSFSKYGSAYTELQGKRGRVLGAERAFAGRACCRDAVCFS
ncbi:MAG: polyphosphate polymerase domain-containing protein, partial [Lachnospiraceae bacterium]|nr:polyphosphate polymerase domain-containing protein [Lachnospiraceae bacterium]